MMCVQHLEVNNYSVAHADGENASLTSKAGALFVSVVFGSQEKRTSIEKSWDQDGRFEWKAPQIELWDGESGEIVEFIVSVERNGVRWRDSMTTVTMGDFRRRPEHRHTIEKPLYPMGAPSSGADATPKGGLRAVLTYTEDCVQPSLFQSLFCTAFVQCGGGLGDSLSMEFGDFFLPLLSAKTRAQQRLLERDWTRDDEDDDEQRGPAEPGASSSSDNSSAIASAVVAGGMPVPALDNTSAAAHET